MDINLDHNKLVNLIYKCREKSISGLVILTNSEFIKDIPPASSFIFLNISKFNKS